MRSSNFSSRRVGPGARLLWCICALTGLTCLLYDAVPGQTSKGTIRLTVTVRDSRNSPVENAKAELVPAYSASKTRVNGVKDKAGLYVFDLPREMMDAPLRLTVAAAGLKTFDKTQYWGQKGKVTITMEGVVAQIPSAAVPAPASGGLPVEVTVSPTRVIAGERVRVAWVGRASRSDVRMRLRLLLPDGETSGISGDATAGWAPMKSGETTLSDLVQPGTYTVVLEYAPRESERDKRSVSTQFSVLWQDPEILTAPLRVDWSMARSRPYGRDSLLAQEFASRRREWSEEAASRIGVLGLSLEAEGTIARLGSCLDGGRLHGLLESALESGRDLSAQGIGGILPPAAIRELAQGGDPGIVRAYRDPDLNRALTMAAITSVASAFFADRARQVSAEEEMERQIAETRADVAPPPVVQPPAEVPAEAPADPAPVEQKAEGEIERPAEPAEAGIAVPEGEEGFGKEGFQVFTGFSVYGPEVGLGTTWSSFGLEGGFTYHLVDWEKNEQLWNKPTSGGYMLSLRVFPVAAGSFITWPVKVMMGLGFARMNERNGKSALIVAGDPSRGYWQWADAQLGVRIFLIGRLAITGWGGMVFWKSDKKSMPSQRPEYKIDERFSKYSAGVSLGYIW